MCFRISYLTLGFVISPSNDRNCVCVYPNCEMNVAVREGHHRSSLSISSESQNRDEGSDGGSDGDDNGDDDSDEDDNDDDNK